MATANEEAICRIVATNTASLRREIDNLRNQLSVLTTSCNVAEHKTEIVDDSIICVESLEIIKSLHEFSGDENTYVSWQEAANNNSMTLYTRGSRRYFAALTILRNKIIKKLMIL